MFKKTKDDDKIGMSVKGRHFIQIIESGLQKITSGNWIVPLPSHPQGQKLPNNKLQAEKRDKARKKNVGLILTQIKNVAKILQDTVFTCQSSTINRPRKHVHIGSTGVPYGTMWAYMGNCWAGFSVFGPTWVSYGQPLVFSYDQHLLISYGYTQWAPCGNPMVETMDI